MLQHIDLRDEISATKLASILFGVVYVSGYLVTAIYVRSRGIASLPFLMAQYIETGLAFCVLTAIPGGTPYLLWKIRGPLGRSGFWDWALLVLTSLVAINLLLVVASMAIFLTAFEWNMRVALLGLDMSLGWMLVPLVLLETAILIGIAVVRIQKEPRPGDLQAGRALKRSRIRAYGLDLVALLFLIPADWVIWSEVFWAKRFVVEALPYAGTIVVFPLAVWVMHFLSSRFPMGIRRGFIWVLGTTALLLCYHWCVTAYSYSVYEYVPSSRGGISPTTRTHIFHKSDSTNANAVPPVVFVLEESDAMLYCVDTTCNWMEAPIFAVPKCDIAYLYVEKLKDGRPHIKPCQ